IIILQTHL
ncbi:hypothetical protein VCEC0012_001264B, partial [Vibrio cholerae O1 str. EC-0012]